MEHGDGPRELTLYVTGACDAHCSFCKRESDVGALNAGTMTPEFVREILDRFPTVTGCCIAGFGEPLLVKNLGDIVDVLKTRGLYVGLVTNGTRLRARNAEIRDWELGHVSVSLNASDAEEHRVVFGVEAWANVYHGIRDLVESIDGSGGTIRTRVGASFVVRRGNVSRVPSYLSRARQLRLHFAHLHNILPHGGPRDISFLAQVLREGTPEASLLRRYQAEWLSRIPAEVSWPALLPPVGVAGPLACQSPFVSVGVDGSGNVTGCRRVQEPSPAFGNFRDPGVWENAHFTRYRAELSGAVPATETCRACFGSVRG